MNSSSLNQLVDVFHKTTDPRDPKGVRHDFHGMIILVFLGLLGQLPYIAWTYRRAKKYWHILRAPLGFKKMKPPVETTISRALAGCSLEELPVCLQSRFRNTETTRQRPTEAENCEPISKRY